MTFISNLSISPKVHYLWTKENVFSSVWLNHVKYFNKTVYLYEDLCPFQKCKRKCVSPTCCSVASVPWKYVDLVCCTEAVAAVKWQQPSLWICRTRSGTVLVVVKAQNSQEPSLTFYSVIPLRLLVMCHLFPAQRLQAEHLAPPDSLPVLHAASRSPLAFTRGRCRQSRNIWRHFYFSPSPLRGLFVSFLSECQAFAWVSKQTSSSRNDVSERCHWSGMSCQSLCWANDYFWVLWELKV